MNYKFDIDGTILFSKLIGGVADGEYEITGKDDELIEIINKLHTEGHVIIIETARHWRHLEKTRDHLFNANVRYTTLVMGKPLADLYIDDKALRPDEFKNKMRGK